MKVFRLFVVFLWACSCSVAFALTPINNLLGSANAGGTTSALYYSYALTGNDSMIWNALADPNFAIFVSHKHPYLGRTILLWQQKYVLDGTGNYLRLAKKLEASSAATVNKHIISDTDWGRIHALYAQWLAKRKAKTE